MQICPSEVATAIFVFGAMKGDVTDGRLSRYEISVSLCVTSEFDVC